jgi:arylsulfatase A-like enzyme
MMAVLSVGAQASIAAFRKVENHTVGSWLTQAGYYTAFLGKYVNSMECDVPSGWRHWGGLTCGNLRKYGAEGIGAEGIGAQQRVGTTVLLHL